MKKILFLLMMLLIPMVGNAQRIDKPGEPYDAYCTVEEVVGKMLVWFAGDKNSSRLLDSDGKEVKVRTKLDIIQYMSKLGWQYFGLYGESDLMFKKQVTSDEEIKQFMYFQEDFKKK